MNKTKQIVIGLLIVALFLTGCQLFSRDEATPTQPAIEIPAETAAPTSVETVEPTATTSAAATNTPDAVTQDAPTATAILAPTVTDPPPVAQRIQFAPGATSATREGTVLAGQQHTFAFGAFGGQTARVELSSADGSANFSVAAMDASPAFKRLDDPARSWQGVLPGTQEYMIIVTAPLQTTYQLTLTIDPLNEPDLPVIVDPGSPPADRCIVAHPGGTAVVTIYLGPSTAFAPIAYLGNWAEVLSSENGWQQIQIGPGQTGWVRETDVVYAGPCDHINETIRFDIPANGSPVRTSKTILPGQADRYVFGAQAGIRALIDLNSTGQANFALLNVESGQPLKRIVNEDRTWQGILPDTGDYMLTVVPGDQAASYELTIGLSSAPPLAAVYDAHTGALLGGYKDAFWVDANTVAVDLLGGEQYGLYHLGQSLGQAAGSAAVPTGGICPGHTVHLTPQPGNTNALAVIGATWEVAPQLVAQVELSQAERQSVADLLTGQGLAVSASDLQVNEAWGTDLDGNGFGEIIVLASRLKDNGSTPSVNAGDYAVAAVLMEISGQLHAEPLRLDVYPQANDLAYPWRYQLSGALDLNGDGLLEVILAGDRWEGVSTGVYSVGPTGGAIKVLERSCTQ